MQRKSWLFTGLVLAGSLVMGGCVVVPPRARMVAVAPAPAPVWVPGYWYGGVWVRGRWRYR